MTGFKGNATKSFIKKFISINLSLALVLSFISINTYALGEKEAAVTEAAKSEKASVATFDKAILEKVIRLVKLKLSIPNNYSEFNSTIENNGSNGSKPVCRLRWSSTNPYVSKDGGSIEVTADEFGNIANFYHYKYNRDNDGGRKLPKIDRETAYSTAKKFALYLCTDIADQLNLEFDRRNSTIDYDGSYRFTFYRQYKGIPYNDNNISVSINGQSGEAMNFNRNWAENIVFQEPDKLINSAAAEAAYKEKIGLKLKYRRTYGESIDKTYLVYMPSSSDSLFSIDAFTGEKVSESSGYNPYYESLYRMDSYKQQLNMEQSLSGQKLDEVKQLDGLISIEVAEKKLKGIAELGLGEAYSVRNYSYSKSGALGYTLRIEMGKTVSIDDFGKDIPEEKIKVMIAAGEGGGFANAVMDAKTGELIEFNTYNNHMQGEQKQTFKREEMQKMIETFLTNNKAGKFKQSKLMDNSGVVNPYAEKYGYAASGTDGSFTYIRNVNNIPFEDNLINISVDSTTGKIINYRENWDQIEFIQSKNLIGLDKAHEVLFKTNKLQLKYISVMSSENKMKYAANDLSVANVKLVYAPDFRKPICVDAQKGILVNYADQQPYKDTGTISYSDISKHSAKKQIMDLAEFGVLPNLDKFSPDSPMLQKDFLYIVSKMRNMYFMENSTGELKQKELDGLYRALINEGVFDEEEREPDSKITKEQAVKYLLNTAGYRKFAELPGIFNNDFKDNKDINKKLEGYIAIAKSLKLIDQDTKGMISPKKVLSRAEAVVIIYNYLMR